MAHNEPLHLDLNFCAHCSLNSQNDILFGNFHTLWYIMLSIFVHLMGLNVS